MTVSEKHIAAAIDLVDSEMFKSLMAVDRIGKCAEMVAVAMAESEARETANLISIIADIRQKSGVGAKPMLGELADAIEARIAAAEREGRQDERKRCAEIAERWTPFPEPTSRAARYWLKHVARPSIARAILSQAGEA